MKTPFSGLMMALLGVFSLRPLSALTQPQPTASQNEATSTGFSENRTRRLRLVTALVSLLVCVSCAKQKSEAEYRPTTTIRDLMDGVVDPAADTIWNSVGTTISKEGTEEKAPHTDEEWGTVRNGAIELLEASNLLQIPGRHVAMPGQLNNQGIELQPPQIETLIAQDRQAWIMFAHGLHDAAM